MIAAEDDEFCVRMRRSGLGIERLPMAMTRHDANMTRFSEWWRRTVRSGHGFAQVGHLHPDHFRPERRRVWLYGLVLPLVALMGLALVGKVAVLAVAALYVMSWLRTTLSLIRMDQAPKEAILHAFFLTLSKFPNLIGMLTYYWRRWREKDMSIIEYK